MDKAGLKFLLENIDLDLILILYNKYYCPNHCCTTNGKAYTFNDFIGWINYEKDRKNV